MKTTFIFALCLVAVSACKLITPPSDDGFLIQAKTVEFPAENKFSATITFENNLGREVNIINVGCAFPSFTLQQSIDGQWKMAGGPVCVALAIAPTHLNTGESFTATVSMYTDPDQIANGTYRLKFDIREQEITKQIPQQYLVSDSFTISR